MSLTSILNPPPADLLKSDSNPQRITLLYKHRDSMVCLLSRDLREITYDQTFEDVFVLKLFGNEKVDILYEPQFTLHRNQGNPGYNTVTTIVDARPVKHKIPFTSPHELASDVLQKGESLEGKINELFEAENDGWVTLCEEIAEKGVLKGFLSRNFKGVLQYHKSVGNTLYNQVSGLFHEEADHIPIKRSALQKPDRGLSNYVKDPRSLSTKMEQALLLGSCIPLFAVLPISFQEYLKREMQDSFDKRFDLNLSETEQETRALSEFIFCNPKLEAGLRKGYIQLKAASNLTMYAAQTAFVASTLAYAPPWVSVLLAIPTVMSGMVMTKNAVNSGRTNYSGIISTVLDAQLRRTMIADQNAKKWRNSKGIVED